jgi:hypothetical protein
VAVNDEEKKQLDAAMDEWIAKESEAGWQPPKLEKPEGKPDYEEVVVPDVVMIRPPPKLVPWPPPPRELLPPKKIWRWVLATVIIAVAAAAVRAVLMLTEYREEQGEDFAAWYARCKKNEECWRWHKDCHMTEDWRNCWRRTRELFP